MKDPMNEIQKFISKNECENVKKYYFFKFI